MAPRNYLTQWDLNLGGNKLPRPRPLPLDQALFQISFKMLVNPSDFEALNIKYNAINPQNIIVAP